MKKVRSSKNKRIPKREALLLAFKGLERRCSEKYVEAIEIEMMMKYEFIKPLIITIYYYFIIY
jgi:hypothetical protein